MSDPMNALDRADVVEREEPWTRRFVLFLRAMAAVSLLKGLYHWGMIVGIGHGPFSAFETNSTAWQAATIYFSVIDPVAAVGLWLAAAWGGGVWVTPPLSVAGLALIVPPGYCGAGRVVLAPAR